jgi:aldehyde:ferredoxin oxidoreductase
VGDPNLGAKLFSAVTGIDSEEFDVYGERICNLQRLILLREGRKVPEADHPPDFNFTDPYVISSKSDIAHIKTVPGPGEKKVPFEGNILQRDKFNNMLKDYYLLRGWDQESGYPHYTTLANLGMDDLAIGPNA